MCHVVSQESAGSRLTSFLPRQESWKCRAMSCKKKKKKVFVKLIHVCVTGWRGGGKIWKVTEGLLYASDQKTLGYMKYTQRFPPCALNALE